MAKMRLTMDDLRVESFPVTSGAGERGTVHGREEMNAAVVIGGGTDNVHDDTCYNTCFGKYSCPGPTMCENTCYPSSPHICC
jgi:hypothetical protein